VLPAVTVRAARPRPNAEVGGWSPLPLSETPLSAQVLTSEQMRNLGLQRLADLGRIDPATGDAYNAEGYWDALTVRGFVIDPRSNYRRDGLPISAETSLPLDNKERLELLKGLSGLQAGTSTPGGLVNLVTKRPLATDRRSLSLGWQQGGSLLAAADVSQRLGPDGETAVRLNLAHEDLQPRQRSADGQRRLLALAGEWQAGADQLLEAELETSRRRQPSVPGFSLLGDTLPSARSIDPRINLNHQSWTQPVVLYGQTASLRWTQRLGDDWRAVAHAMHQRLHSDDRIAFPYGLYDANYACNPCDRYAADGRMSLWEYVSDNESRVSDAQQLSLHGRARTGSATHELSLGVLHHQTRARFQTQVFDLAGTGSLDGQTQVPASAGFTDENTNRDERNLEFFVRDAVQLAPDWRLWLGLRHARLQREAVRTDGSRPTSYRQNLSTPMLGLSHQLAPRRTAYASWGQGLESDVAPNRARYTNAGRALPVARSRQVELGIKQEMQAAPTGSGTTADLLQALGWTAALFDIQRPVYADLGSDCSSDTLGNTCTRQLDGTQHHRGIEASAQWRQGPWALQAGLQWLRATREGSATASLNGLRPVNVPARSLKLLAERTLQEIAPAGSDVVLQAGWVHEGKRIAVADNSLAIPGWSRLDLGARWTQRSNSGQTLTWRVGLDNALDQRAWKEAPTQYGHVYLFPLQPRTWRASLQAEL
jgi:iron complex outermembrane recepter protein